MKTFKKSIIDEKLAMEKLYKQEKNSSLSYLHKYDNDKHSH